VGAHASGRDRTPSQLILAVLMLEVWLSSYLPRAAATAPPSAASVRVPA